MIIPIKKPNATIIQYFIKKKSGRKKVIFKKNKGIIRVLNGSENIDFINVLWHLNILK